MYLQLKKIFLVLCLILLFLIKNNNAYSKSTKHILKEKINPGLFFIPGVKITASPGSEICQGTAITFKAVPINQSITAPYRWRKNGVIINGNTSTISDNNFSNGDIITCTMYSGGNLALPVISNSIELTIKPAPAVPVISANGPTTFCKYFGIVNLSTSLSGVSYTWLNNGSNYWQPTNAPSIDVANLSGVHNISLKVTKNGCSSYSNIIPVTILDHPPPATIITSGPLSFCEGASSVTLSTNTSAIAYEWKYGSSVVGTSLTYTIDKQNQTGPYSLTITGANGCKSTPSGNQQIFVNVYYGKKPIIWKTGNKLEVHKDNMNQLSGSRKWQNYYGNIIGTAYYLYPTNPGYYKVQVSNAGCITPYSDFTLYQQVAEKYSVYPSIATSSVSIVSNSLINSISATITNTAGASMTSNLTFVAMTSANISSYPPGNYTIKLTDMSTGAVESKTFIKQ